MKKLIVITVAILSMAAGCSDDAGSDAERLAVANEMVTAWNSKDWERVYELFADDGVLHSVMNEPIVGRDAIRERLAPMLAGIDRIELELRHIGIVDDVVVLERTDDFVYNGEHARVPVVGVMEIAGGKITEWREYYDKASLVAALTPDDTDAAAPDVETRILALTKQLSVDWNAGRMAEYLAAYDDEAPVSLMFGDRILAGKENIVALFTSTWTTEPAMGDFDTSDVDVRVVAPGVALVSGLFEHRFEHETVRGSFSHLWKLDGAGRWKIVHEHTSRAMTE